MKKKIIKKRKEKKKRHPLSHRRESQKSKCGRSACLTFGIIFVIILRLPSFPKHWKNSELAATPRKGPLLYIHRQFKL